MLFSAVLSVTISNWSFNGLVLLYKSIAESQMSKILTVKNSLFFLFALLLVAPVTGELWRLNILFFQFLPSDLIIPPLFILWVIYKIKFDRVWRLGKIGRMVILFLFVITIAYLINLFRFPLKEMVVAFSNLGRFGMYLVLSVIAFDFLDADKSGGFRRIILYSSVFALLAIVLLGFLQLKFFPSFYELGLQLQGWDPHIGRLLSTWFDPNFIGGYLAFMLGPLIALLIYARHKRNKRLFGVLLILCLFTLFALYYTFSRSGYLALMVVLVLLAFFKSRKLLVAGFLCALLAFTFSPRVQERTLEAWTSGKSFIGLDAQRPLDPTAELRVWSWKFALEMISEHPWVGIGYNRYPYEINQRGHGLLSGHASGGSDSSLLTLWATSGIFGLLTYLSIGFVAAIISIRRLWKTEDFRSYLDAGLVAGFGGLMLHSIFVNSLTFPLMMIYIFIGLALLDEH